MRKFITLFLACIISTFLYHNSHAATGINPKLEDEIKNELQIDQLTPSEIESVKELDLSEKELSNLEGLEKFTNLEELDLSHNNLTDIAELDELRNLEKLFLQNNQISEVSPLSSKPTLQVLSLSSNTITDITGLDSLPALKELRLNNNGIDDVRPLTSFEGLHRLFLNNNNLSTLEGVGGLTELTYLWVDHNTLTNLEQVTELRQLESLHFQWNDIQDTTPMEDLSELESVWGQYNKITDISPLYDKKQLSEIKINHNFINVSAGSEALQWLKSIPSSAYLPQEQESGKRAVEFADDKLEASIKEMLEISSATPVFHSDVNTIRTLNLTKQEISDLSGLEEFTSLKEINISHNNIKSLVPLSELPLEKIYASNNEISNLYPLRGLEDLTHLGLSDNKIDNITYLNNLKNIKWLNLNNNSIEDLYALSELRDLEELHLTNNLIRSIKPLQRSYELSNLWINNNRIDSIKPLRKLNELEILHLSGNRVSNIESLKQKNDLTDLYVSENSIVDITPLKNLKALRHLNLSDNNVQDIAPLTGHENLSTVLLNNNDIFNAEPLENLRYIDNLDITQNDLLLNLSKNKNILNHWDQSSYIPQKENSISTFEEQVQVSPSKSWKIEFNHPPEELEFNIEVIDSTGAPVPVTFRVDKKTVVVSPNDQGYEEGKKYKLLINKSLSFSGQHLSNHTVMAFTVGDKEDTPLHKTLSDAGGVVLPYEDRPTEVIIKASELEIPNGKYPYLKIGDIASFELNDDQNGYFRAENIPEYYSEDQLMEAEIIYE
ncbi:leucine-rich repeat domain-containing protein [Salimicrobium halophilum]|uniref:Leucine-rich repeat (LRR) protein n=1 Tax=Salimicrobium halophilum TaxID=86666 RepID=A0A1G8S0W5_9BACI|nr:leucine-rich repeat domain-containing protein [Salimicrobium halophilum]SDJ22857.1 Leucine-rich repeat (LRR) protein [Salimicrobium halophilum]